MRNNNLKDLYVDYPFLPVASAPAWFKSIKYMRIMVTLPVCQPKVIEHNGATVSVYLKAITATDAIVHVDCLQYDYHQDLSVKIFVGSIPCGNSYLYTTEDLPVLSGLSYQIHPDCLVFQQEAPVLHMEVWNGSSSPVMTLEYNGEHDISQWLKADLVEKLMDQVLWLANGHNVEVSGSSDTVIFTGTPGAGKGIWDTPPYSTESTTFDGHRGVGLHSINGKTGQVFIRGDRSVDVQGSTTNTLILKPVAEV